MAKGGYQILDFMNIEFAFESNEKGSKSTNIIKGIYNKILSGKPLLLKNLRIGGITRFGMEWLIGFDNGNGTVRLGNNYDSDFILYLADEDFGTGLNIEINSKDEVTLTVK